MATTMGDDPNTDQASGSGTPGGATPTSTPIPPPPPRRNGFFDWIRGLGIVRIPGWIGGVCAGIGARLGIDPLIVRGIVVVIAVLGGPVVLLYAAAWLLLPDENDLIHAEEVGRGRFSPAIAGIGALALLSLLSLSSGSWFLGPVYGDVADVRGVVGEVVGRVIWLSILVTAIVLFVMWVSRRSNSSAPAPSGYAAGPAPAGAGDGATAATAEFAASSTAPPAFAAEPPRPGTAASSEELAAWRQQQDEWKRQRAAWAAEQKRTDRELAAQVARENSRRNAEAAIERARIRRLTNPRISGAYVLITIGLAIVVGALAALLWQIDGGGYDATVGWAAAVFVLGAAIAVAGALRRRSGFLTFLSIVALLILLATTTVPSGRQFLWPGAHISVANMMSGSYAQPAGSIELTVWEDNSEEVPEIDIWQGRGTVSIFVEEGQTVEVVANTDGQDVRVLRPPGREQETVTYRSSDDGRFESTTVAGAEGAPDALITLWQGRGTVTITELP